ncbi:MAG: cobalt-precorrin 5A hydrolase [Firmicutes bacterium HGW-Firmicutes-1]|jgi:cobalt-precorrin 5A hydrolase|nr:MAG: cobalt-precorrin 5A hydrolase [Firmicutes bacterium HGW-Firmicutes-1]
MKLAIITLTTGGVYQAKKLKRHYMDATLYTLKKHLQEGFLEIEPSLSDLVAELFETYEGIVFIMSTGIVVRTIAPFIQHKTIDPAIMVMDEKGEYIISLLSGHIGKANDFTIDIASHMSALPIITTASDVNGKMAVDTMADYLGCHIDSMEAAKKITIGIIENKKIGILCDFPININLDDQFTVLEGNVDDDSIENENIEGLIIVSKENPRLFKVPNVWLIPKDIVVGIGCRRGKTKEELLKALKNAFEIAQLSVERIEKLVTVDIKKDELGLLELARTLKVPLVCLPRDVIRKVEDRFEGSEFVNETLGIKSVCEPCGYIGSAYGNCLLPKQQLEGITISIWEKAQSLEVQSYESSKINDSWNQ